jgi:hypothetical protein
VTIGKEIWHSGFRVALGSAVLTPASAQCNSGELVIDAEFFNRGREAAEFPARVLVNSNGTDYEESRSYGDRPYVPGQRSGKSVFRLKVDSEFDLNSATLVIGDAGDHQAVVPLGPSSPDKFVSLVVPDLPISGSMSAGDMVVKFDYAWLRADEPWSHETLSSDEMNLSIGFSATCDVWHCYLGLGALSLTLPDGTSVAADDEPNEVWTTTGTTVQDLSVLFTIESPPEGKYVLHMKGDWGESTDEVEAEFPFTIERQPTFSGI